VRAYELVYIIKPLEDEATNAVVDKFKTLIENNGGEIAKLDKWGKRKLAYEIAGFKEGFYVLCNFKGEAAVAQELDRVLKITDEVIKHLIVKEEEE